MNITVTSGSIQAAAAVLTLMAAFFLWVIKMIVSRENTKLLRDINGTYIRSAGSRLTGHEIENRFRTVEGDIGVLKRIVIPGQ